MPVSLTPLLAAAVAMFAYLLSREPIISLVTGFVSWRALNALATASRQTISNADVRNPLPGPTGQTSALPGMTATSDNDTQKGPKWLTNWVKNAEIQMENRRNASIESQNNDGPPLLTDIFKPGRNRQSSTTDSSQEYRNRDAHEEKPDVSVRSVPTPSTESATASKSESKPAPVARRQRQNADMHTMPEYMIKLTTLDQRVSRGEVSDTEYDVLYDKILATAN